MNDIFIKTLLLTLLISFFSFYSCSSHRYAGEDYTKNHSLSKAKKRDYTKNRSITAKRPSSSTKKKTYKSTPSEVSSERTALIRYASTLQGIPYEYGGKNTQGFDCSGFTSYVYEQQGKSLKGNTNMQVQQGTRISLGQAQKGDLLFFGSSQKISHVALIVENTKDKLVVIHATSSKGVIQQDITHSTYWRPKILYAVNVWENGKQESHLVSMK